MKIGQFFVVVRPGFFLHNMQIIIFLNENVQIHRGYVYFDMIL